VGSSFDAIDFAELEGVNSEIMEFSLVNSKFGLASEGAILEQRCEGPQNKLSSRGMSPHIYRQPF